MGFSRGQHAEHNAYKSHSARLLSYMRVLLVEDEPDLGAAIKRNLNQEKYVVDWVLDGTEAWDYLESQWTQYTLAIFDWLLPGLSGLELCKRLRKQKNTLPVLMLTAKDRLEDMVTGLDAGADDYLVQAGKSKLPARLEWCHQRHPLVEVVIHAQPSSHPDYLI